MGDLARDGTGKQTKSNRIKLDQTKFTDKLERNKQDLHRINRDMDANIKTLTSKTD